MKRSYVAIVVAWLTAAGCAGVPDESGDPSVGPVHLEETLSLGCSNCDGPAQFGQVANVAIDPDGRIFVVSRYQPFLRVFRADGEHEFSLGREGQGPGELMSPWYVFFGSDGNFMVVELGFPRVSRFSPAGKFIDVVQTASGQITNADYDAANDMLYLAQGWASVPAVNRLRVGTSEAVAVRSGNEAFPRSRDGGPGGGFFGFAVRPGGGFVIGDRWWAYRLQLFDADGTPAGETGRPIPRTPLTQDELDTARAANERLEERGLGSRRIDVEKSHFDQWSLRYDDTGRLWIRTTRTPLSITTFDIFDVDDEYLGEITLPLRIPRVATSFDVAAGRLAAIVLDELDNPTVRVWRVADR